ncbi:hypothetical protein [Taibaiella soli]|uniref:Thioredoxin domain-containing protein n=1 Tax=Taibaiella soli TaxID=1649169 RepID=A0A2W2ASL5_9BACT|nr:hypothetical protein [Taibaiella soli]PZF70934.1 hypothetical protein DN068_21145 [Taibaiella soli]
MQRKLLIAGLVCCSLLAFAQKQKDSKQQATNVKAKPDTATTDYKLLGAPMPSIKLVTQKGKVITDKELQNDAHLFVMMFNPFCEHCEDQTELFKKNMALFKKTKLVMMAGPMMVPNLEYFENMHKVSEFPDIIMGVDSSGFIDKTFLYRNLPQINIYDKDRRLERVFAGDVPMDSLSRYIE